LGIEGDEFSFCLIWKVYLDLLVDTGKVFFCAWDMEGRVYYYIH